MTETFNRLNAVMAESVTLRSRDEVTALFTGLELVPPGVVQTTEWRPDPAAAPARPGSVWGGVARKTG
jgi:S-adenosyl methyltransferase